MNTLKNWIIAFLCILCFYLFISDQEKYSDNFVHGMMDHINKLQDEVEMLENSNEYLGRIIQKKYENDSRPTSIDTSFTGDTIWVFQMGGDTLAYPDKLRPIK